MTLESTNTPLNTLKPPPIPCLVFLYPKNKREIPKYLPNDPKKNTDNPKKGALGYQKICLTIIQLICNLLYRNQQACFLGSQKKFQKTGLRIYRHIFWVCQAPFLGSSGILFGIVRQLFLDLNILFVFSWNPLYLVCSVHVVTITTCVSRSLRIFIKNWLPYFWT